MFIPSSCPDLPLWRQLSPREWEVILLLADDFNTCEVMEQLCIERKSVEKHKTTLAAKLDQPGRGNLNRYARRHREALREWHPVLCRRPSGSRHTAPPPHSASPA